MVDRQEIDRQAVRCQAEKAARWQAIAACSKAAHLLAKAKVGLAAGTPAWNVVDEAEVVLRTAERELRGVKR